MKLRDNIHSTCLENGLRVVVVPRHHIPKVSVQLWYNVGSKDEKTGYKGIAHLIEHMIFKGTKKLTESDINVLVHKLSGSCNAFTSHDYTGYLFDMPSQHWKDVFPVMVECMDSCTFKEQLLNSELKAVVQELKMYNDDHISVLIERMMGCMFHDHPYHYPVIGYKQDLWNLNRENLLDFYKTYYKPNNATLVVVGDVDPEEVFEVARENWAGIPAGEIPERNLYHSDSLIGCQTVSMQQDVQQPFSLMCWKVPGVKEKKDYILDVLSWIVGAGKGSHLYSTLVTQEGLATEVQSFVYDLFDCGIFCVYAQPVPGVDQKELVARIQKEIDAIAQGEITPAMIRRARKKSEMDFLGLSENNQKSAYLFGKHLTATGSVDSIRSYGEISDDQLQKEVSGLIRHYLSPHAAYHGYVDPICEDARERWCDLQQKSDQEDIRVLEAKERTVPIEEARYALSIEPKEPQSFAFPRAQEFVLSNGLKVLYCHNPRIAKIDLFLDLKAKYYYDSDDCVGRYVVLTDLMQEGAGAYSAQEFAYQLESHGMQLNTFPGHVSMSMLSDDFVKGLNLLSLVLTEARCEQKSFDQIIEQTRAEIRSFWDDPNQCASQLTREKVYAGHPFSKHIMGTEKSLYDLSLDSVKQAYKDYIVPQEARLVIVGDCGAYNLQEILENSLGGWQGNAPESIKFPHLSPVQKATYTHEMNRDQVVLCYGGLSVDRKNSDFDKLLLFDQIFTGGSLGSMSSRLFALREQTGLFYTIGGSVVAGAGKQPGMVFIKTIVSPDKVMHACNAIEETMRTSTQDITKHELVEAKRAISHALIDHFATNRSTANALLFLDTYKLPKNYFDTRMQSLNTITVDDVKSAVCKYVDPDKLITYLVGRVL